MRSRPEASPCQQTQGRNWDALQFPLAVVSRWGNLDNGNSLFKINHALAGAQDGLEWRRSLLTTLCVSDASLKTPYNPAFLKTPYNPAFLGSRLISRQQEHCCSCWSALSYGRVSASDKAVSSLTSEYLTSADIVMSRVVTPESPCEVTHDCDDCPSRFNISWILGICRI